MKPEFILINWYRGAVVGEGTEDECRAQLEKISNGPGRNDAYVIAEVKVRSQMKRIES